MVVTKTLPGERWLQFLINAGCRVEVSQHPDIILSNATIKQLIGTKCDGVIGQLTEVGLVSAGAESSGGGDGGRDEQGGAGEEMVWGWGTGVGQWAAMGGDRASVRGGGRRRARRQGGAEPAGSRMWCSDYEEHTQSHAL